MPSFIITFGKAHRHENVQTESGETIIVDKDCVVQIDSRHEFNAYEKASQLFGENWNGITSLEHYNSEKAWEFFPRGIVATFKT